MGLLESVNQVLGISQKVEKTIEQDLKERDDKIAELTATVKERDEKIANFEASLGERDEKITEKDDKIIELQGQVSERDGKIAEQEAKLKDPKATANRIAREQIAKSGANPDTISGDNPSGNEKTKEQLWEEYHALPFDERNEFYKKHRATLNS